MRCKRITGDWSRVPGGAISLIPRTLYGARLAGGLKLVTQKVRLRVINGEESLSAERLFGVGRESKSCPLDNDHGIETL